MKPTVLILIGALVAGCSPDQTSGSAPAGKPAGEAPPDQLVLLRDTYWKLVEIGGMPVVTKENAGEAHLILDSADARAHGSGGCNRFFAQYRSTGEALSFSAVGSTMMACPEGLDTEQAFFSALGQTGHAQITGRILELYGPEGLLARLEAVNPD